MVGFLKSTNTGVPVGVSLPRSGGLIINTTGAVTGGLDIHGTVIINSLNDTLQDCKVTAANFVVLHTGNDGSTGFGIAAATQRC